MFKSPLHYCRVRKVWVALDTNVERCHAINACPRPCPYEALFDAVDELGKELVVRCKAPPVMRPVAC